MHLNQIYWKQGFHETYCSFLQRLSRSSEFSGREIAVCRIFLLIAEFSGNYSISDLVIQKSKTHFEDAANKPLIQLG